MSEYTARVTWQRSGATFTDNAYSRAHVWSFDGGVQVPASASPQVVPPPHSMEAAVDPEEALIASLSSCHMLWFLSIAAGKGYVVDAYRDDATGRMGRIAKGRIAVTEVTLRPVVRFGGAAVPAPGEHEAMHEEAHGRCFIANSVTATVRCEPTIEDAAPA